MKEPFKTNRKAIIYEYESLAYFMFDLLDYYDPLYKIEYSSVIHNLFIRAYREKDEASQDNINELLCQMKAELIIQRKKHPEMSFLDRKLRKNLDSLVKKEIYKTLQIKEEPSLYFLE